MPIPDIYFSPADDYHLLRGQQVDLLHILRVGDVSATDYKTAHNTTTIKFKPLFLGTATGTNYHSDPLKLKVDTSTGVVEATAGTPAKFKRNFIVEVEAEDSADPGKKQTTIRIHVHNHVTQAWLTPPTLTIRPSGKPLPELTRFRFSVRAEFDDGTVGDVTNHPGIDYKPDANAFINGYLAIEPEDDPGNPPITITATLPANLEGKPATGQMKIAKPWDAEADIPVEIIPGGGWGGTLSPQKVMNVLFLCDGYQAPDVAKFNSQVMKFVDLLRGSTITTPFNYLATSINFWWAFVPSRVRGTSFLCEMYIKTLGSLEAEPVPNPVKPPDTGNWSLENLVYAVGLPVMTEGAISIGDLKTLWGSLVAPLPFDRIPDGIIGEWRNLGSRTMLEEVDTEFSMVYGRRPTSGSESDNRQTNLHPDRMNRVDLDRMLNKLKDVKHGVDIAGVWHLKPDLSKPDHGIVFLLTSAKWDRGTNYGPYIALNVEERNTVRVDAVVGKQSYELNQSDLMSAEIAGPRMIRGAHELTHSFFLGDEYNEAGTFTGQYNLDDLYSNLQFSGDVKSGADIDGTKIKWRWPRIKNAAVITGEPTEPQPGVFRIPVVTSQGNQFKKGETILLRMRSSNSPLKKTTTVIAKELEVTDPHEANAVSVKGKGAAAVTVAELKAFPEGSIVFSPVEAPASVLSATYPYAELIAKNIMDHITARKRALNMDPADAHECSGDKNAIQPPVKLNIPLSVPADKLPGIIGLYTGGDKFDCGIYHPAGSCIMRNSNADGKEFCQVCKYVLVDMINPYKHWEIDREYAKVYPQK